jgi:ABC-type phosphate/phosphonate transport system permease subunit
MDDLFPIALAVWVFAAWITHIVVCLQTAAWGFLIAGAIVFPIAWIHGTGIWLGVF